MRKLVALSLLACGLLVAAAMAGGSVWAREGLFAPPGRPTLDISIAREALKVKQPAAADELGDEDFDGSLDAAPVTSEDDPLEAINRPIFDFNLTLDRWVLRPITRIYIETVPQPGRTGISNLLSNVRSPVVFANDLLQGEMSRAGATFGRFFINTFFGLGGLFDTAGALGLPGHDEDFGQTLASFGVGGTPYLVLPFIGPSNPRDALGDIADIGLDPLTYVAPTGVNLGRYGTTVISDRAAILPASEALEETSIDFYAAVRSLYYQNRDFEIGNGRSAKAPEANTPEPGASTPSNPAGGTPPGEGESDPLDSFE